MDIGGMTPFTHAIREREKVNNLLEDLCGARLTFNYMRIGGVAWDLPPGYAEQVTAFLDQFEPFIAEYNDLISYNKIYVERLANVAAVSKEEAINYNLVGPNLRGCGFQYDVRRDEPYSIYPELDFDVPVGTGEVGTLGDCFDRYMVRIKELKESCKIVRQCLDMIPDGPVLARVAKKLKPPVGDAHVRVEASRGDMGWYVVSDGSEFSLSNKN